MTDRQCAQCGGSMEGRRLDALFCSRNCAARARYHNGVVPTADRRCAQCGGSMEGRRANAIYCSDRCNVLAWKVRTMGFDPSTARKHATRSEMEQRNEFLIDYAQEHGPVAVRGLYYQAELNHLPGIDKHESSYTKIQAAVLKLRRSGDLDYEHIADATRWMHKPTSFDSVADALDDTARSYRKNLWLGTDEYIEIWCEKDALAGVIYNDGGVAGGLRRSDHHFSALLAGRVRRGLL
jgi:hypothetical protein